MAVPSPCINVCRIEPASGWCEGCARTLEEIAAWSGLDDAAKQVVLQRLPARRGPQRSLAPATKAPCSRLP
ncbi:MAG: DUF1289 domain-containing protein [Rubrivivax sp.]